MKNKDIIMEIIMNNSVNNYSTISNKQIIEIAAMDYNKKLYDKTINDALLQLETLGYIDRHTITNGIISCRTIYITNNNIANIRQKNKVLEIVNSIEKGSCLTTNEINKIFCEDLLNKDNIEFIALIKNENDEKIIEQIYAKNKKIVQTILTELAETNKIIEHKATKKLGRNVSKKIKDKVQNLPTNTKYYTPKRNK